MKIIKSYDDPEFFQKTIKMYKSDTYSSYTAKGNIWKWGLGDDGKLYCQCSDFADSENWHSLGICPTAADVLSISDMKKIIKEFGHLLVWL